MTKLGFLRCKLSLFAVSQLDDLVLKKTALQLCKTTAKKDKKHASNANMCFVANQRKKCAARAISFFANQIY